MEKASTLGSSRNTDLRREICEHVQSGYECQCCDDQENHRRFIKPQLDQTGRFRAIISIFAFSASMFWPNTSHHTHIFDFRHVIPSRLLTPDETLNTSDINQNKFTTSHTVLPAFIDKDVWRVVAVTLEKNVAIVVMLTYRVVALSFSSARNIGSAEKSRIRLYSNTRRQHNSPFSPNLCNSSATTSIAFSEPASRTSFIYLINSRYWWRRKNKSMYKHCKRRTILFG